jgi:hypothetical protein
MVVDRLLFPVKLIPCLLGLTLLIACGYRPVYGGRAPETRLAVTSASHKVAEPGAVDAVLDAVRRTLTESGVLAGPDGYPRLVIEVLRIDEAPRGMIALPATSDRSVSSRGAAVAVTARGWVVEQAGARPTRDTGDVRRVVTFAHSDDPRLDALARGGAVRSAGNEAGEALARRVLGEPEPPFESL